MHVWQNTLWLALGTLQLCVNHVTYLAGSFLSWKTRLLVLFRNVVDLSREVLFCAYISLIAVKSVMTGGLADIVARSFPYLVYFKSFCQFLKMSVSSFFENSSLLSICSLCFFYVSGAEFGGSLLCLHMPSLGKKIYFSRDIYMWFDRSLVWVFCVKILSVITLLVFLGLLC